MSNEKMPLRTPLSYPESALPPHVKKLIRPRPLIKARSLAFLMFEKPDLDATLAFLIDFGLHPVSRTADRLVMRANGAAPATCIITRGKRARYVGAAFVVSAEEIALLESKAGAKPLSPELIPSDGIGAELQDPAGNLVWFVAGQQAVEPLPMREPLHLTANDPRSTRRVNETVRPPLEPAAITRLGHVVLQTVDFATMARWYMRHLGLIPTDVQYLADGTPNLCFFRLDVGGNPADHHTLVLVGGLEEKYEHSAYEVVDLDAIGQGHNVLRANGHRHMWGIGRHILGSQLFDYWYDPDGMEFEHYADGDCFTADYETHYGPLDLSGIWAWGDDVPKSMTGRRNLATLFKAIALLRSGRITGSRLKLLARAMSAPARPWL